MYQTCPIAGYCYIKKAKQKSMMVCNPENLRNGIPENGEKRKQTQKEKKNTPKLNPPLLKSKTDNGSVLFYFFYIEIALSDIHTLLHTQTKRSFLNQWYIYYETITEAGNIISNCNEINFMLIKVTHTQTNKSS